MSPDWSKSRRKLTSKTSAPGKNEKTPVGIGKMKWKCEEKAQRQDKDQIRYGERHQSAKLAQRKGSYQATKTLEEDTNKN